MRMRHIPLVFLFIFGACCKQESSPKSDTPSTSSTGESRSAPQATATQAPTAAKATAQPVEDVSIVKAEADKTGKLHVTDSSGKTVTMPGKEWYGAAVVGSSKMVFGATIGGNANASGTTLVLFDNHKKELRQIPGPNLYICDWEFTKNDTQVAIGGCPSHGPWSYSLVNVKTGRELEDSSSGEIECAKLPKWAQNLCPNK